MLCYYFTSCQSDMHKGLSHYPSSLPLPAKQSGKAYWVQQHGPQRQDWSASDWSLVQHSWWEQLRIQDWEKTTYKKRAGGKAAHSWARKWEKAGNPKPWRAAVDFCLELGCPGRAILSLWGQIRNNPLLFTTTPPGNFKENPLTRDTGWGRYGKTTTEKTNMPPVPSEAFTLGGQNPTGWNSHTSACIGPVLGGFANPVSFNPS